MPDSGPVRRVLVVAVLLGLLTGGVWIVTGESADGRACRDPLADVPDSRALDVPANGSTVNATVRRIGPEAIRYTYGNLSGVAADFGPGVPAWLQRVGVRIQSARGFAVYRSENGTSLVWNESIQDPQVTVGTVPSPDRGGLDAAGAAITPDWAFLPLLPHGVPTNVTLAADQPGVVGDQVLLLGPHRTVRREAGCQDVLLHVPTAVDTAEDPAAIADSLAAASNDLGFGQRYQTVRVFGVGDPIRPGGRVLTHEVWVHAGATFDRLRDWTGRYPPTPSHANRWLHEYLHTLGGWGNETAPDSRWLTEAVPSYYTVTETARQGRLDRCNASRYWEGLNRSLHLGPGTVNLSAPRTYEGTAADYTQGAYVLAALDAEIRVRTGGLRSLQDVLRRLDGAGDVTGADLRRAVRQVVGPGMDAWLDRYVAGTAIPPPPARPLECVRVLASPTPLQFVLLVAVLGVAAALAGRLLGAVLFG